MIWRKSFYYEVISNTVVVFLTLLFLYGLLLLGQLLVKISNLPSFETLILLSILLIKTLPHLLSFSLFAGLVATFSRMSRNREYEAWCAVGLGGKNWIFSSLTIALPLAILVGVLTVYIVPWSLRIAKQYEAYLISHVQLEDSVPGTFVETANRDLVYYFEMTAASESQVRNFFASKILENGDLRLVFAANGATEHSDELLRTINLNSGYIYTVSFADQIINSFNFSTANLQFSNDKPQQIELSLRIQTIDQLLEGDTQAQVELLWRYTFPIITLLLATLALPAGRINPTSGKENKFFLAILGYWLLFSITGLCKELGLNQTLPPILAAGLPVILLGAILCSMLLISRFNR